MYINGLSDFNINLIKESSVLSSEEEEQLFISLRDEPDSRNKVRERILKSNLKLVAKIALKYFHICSDIFTFDDLFSYGEIGLIKAIDRFDVSKKIRFSTYATFWINHEMLEAFSLKNFDLYLSYDFYRKMTIYNEKKYQYYGIHEEFPTVEKMIELTGFSYETVVLIEHNLGYDIRLDSPISNDGNSTVLDFVKDDSISVENKFDNNELRSIFCDIFEKINISQRNKEIIILRYGLDGNGKRTLTYLASKYGISQQAIRQIEQRVLRKIRNEYSKMFTGYLDFNTYKK